MGVIKTLLYVISFNLNLRVYNPYTTCCIHPVLNINVSSISIERIGFIHWHYLRRFILKHAIIGKINVTINLICPDVRLLTRGHAKLSPIIETVSKCLRKPESGRWISKYPYIP